MAKITGRAFAKALQAAGVIGDPSLVERIIIDVASATGPVRVHVQHLGDERLLSVAALLADQEKKGVRYWVLISGELIEPGRLPLPACLRFIEPGGYEGTARWWLIEDTDAPEDMDGKRVELVIRRGRTSEEQSEGGSCMPVVVDRKVV